MKNVREEVKNLDINTSKELPEWLTPEVIEEYRSRLKKAVPYTYTEMIEVPFDSAEAFSDRMRAYDAKLILEQYGLI